MKIITLELMIAITRQKLFEMPEKEEIEGLEGNAAENFRKLSDALSDAEHTLQRMKNTESVRKMFRPPSLV